MHQDHLSSTSLMTNATGSQIGSTIKYRPFGETLSGSVPTDKKFTGQRLDDVTGLYYYNARYYDPTIGRFISPDSITHSKPLPYGKVIKGLTVYLTNTTIYADQTRNPRTINPQEHNRYSYALNNPLKYYDPDGHQVAFGLEWIFIGLAAGGLGIYYYAVVAPELRNQGVDTSINSAIDYVADKIKEGISGLGSFFSNLFKGNESEHNKSNNNSGEAGNPNNNKPLKPGNVDPIKDNYLKNNGINAHEVKSDILGPRSDIDKWNIVKDKSTGEIWLRSSDNQWQWVSKNWKQFLTDFAP